MGEDVVEGIASSPGAHFDGALACTDVLRPVAFDTFAVAASAALDICSIQIRSAPFLVRIDVKLRYGPSYILRELREAVGVEPLVNISSIVTCYVVSDEDPVGRVAVDQR